MRKPSLLIQQLALFVCLFVLYVWQERRLLEAIHIVILEYSTHLAVSFFHSHPQLSVIVNASSDVTDFNTHFQM